MYVLLLVWKTPSSSLNIFGRYIANLDPAYILALAETASFHQLSVLRDAIWKHLALQTSIMVKIPVTIQFPRTWVQLRWVSDSC